MLTLDFKADEAVLETSATDNDFTFVSTDYMTLASIRGLVISNTGVAGIDFDKTSMNGNQYYKLSEAPWYSAFATTNNYHSADLKDIYVGRIYSSAGWSQVAALDWSKVVNTSVWENNAILPEVILSNINNLRIHSPAKLSIPPSGKLTIYGGVEIGS